ncbi:MULTISPECIES: MarR family winged helix-turn-helix transcriptional regulator [Microbacterium]|jgi:DNA-binding MarR family transcriptional regulator|uniref:MarR family winged helix-turn-helix transcriptional regulator n=1 Tax=Microbacterium TaxID=33882 RepID=UPI0006F4CDEB|nr:MULTISPECIES: MarR family transcriptional regulator [Microbacterium]KQR25895.1 MarR family transcriptional regulator [Microbacterium sp. Leaf151]MCI9859277.1 MarR family transcriptional regulator [Microbacterium proteolyticum]
MTRRLPVDPIAEAKRQWLAHGWDDAADGMTVVTSVIRAHQLLMASIDRALRPCDLSFSRFEMLRLLAFTREGRMPMASAITRLQVHPTSVTNTVERLTRDGLISREPHPTDGRAALLVLSAAGRRRVDEATEALNAVFADLGLDDDDATALVRIIARFRKGAGDFADPAPVPDPL